MLHSKKSSLSRRNWQARTNESEIMIQNVMLVAQHDQESFRQMLATFPTVSTQMFPTRFSPSCRTACPRAKKENHKTATANFMMPPPIFSPGSSSTVHAVLQDASFQRPCGTPDHLPGPPDLGDSVQPGPSQSVAQRGSR